MMLLMLIVAVLLQCFDQYSTLALIPLGGIEANPIAVWLFGLIGIKWTVILCKTVAVGALCLIALIRDKQVAIKTLATLDGIYFVMLGIFNLRHLLR